MKTNQTLSIKTFQLENSLERNLEAGHSRLLELARKNARHLAANNRPDVTGDNLSNYTGEFKAGYEKLSADVLQALQPATNFPEAKVDADFFKAKEAICNKKIDELEKQNQDDNYHLDNFNPGTIKGRIRWAIISTAIIFIGEVLFNTKAFQVTGESLLFALLLSVCISFAVFVFSHAAPLLYKAAKTLLQRRLILTGSLVLVTGIFTAMAIFRSTYLALHDIHIKPGYFVVINLFFFIVSAIVSFFVLPTWPEIRENAEKLKTLLAIEKRKTQIKAFDQEKETIKENVKRLTKDRIRILYLSKYVVNKIDKMYRESIATFKATNLNFRGDLKSPDCFNEPVPAMEIDEQAFNLLQT